MKWFARDAQAKIARRTLGRITTIEGNRESSSHIPIDEARERLGVAAPKLSAFWNDLRKDLRDPEFRKAYIAALEGVEDGVTVYAIDERIAQFRIGLDFERGVGVVLAPGVANHTLAAKTSPILNPAELRQLAKHLTTSAIRLEKGPIR